ncbi:MAG: trypsin-like peptidase domain-containing protein [Clostridia bacterium]
MENNNDYFNRDNPEEKNELIQEEYVESDSQSENIGSQQNQPDFVYQYQSNNTNNDIPKRTKKKKLVTQRALVACMLIMTIVGCGIGVVIMKTAGGDNEIAFVSPTPIVTSGIQGNGTKPSTQLVINTAPQVLGSTAKEIVQKCMEPIVSIFIATNRNGSVSTGSGSGVIITSDGYIVTNNHVVEGANEITVYMQDGSVHAATLIGTDSRTDLAIVKIDAVNLKTATIGKSSFLEIGDSVYAIGNPLGELASTVTSGIISGKDRAVEIDGISMTLLQTDAAINPGNSGGGLFNASTGELIGVVNAKSFGLEIEGLGFAIPIDSATPIITQLMDQGFVSGRPYIGVNMQNVTVRTGDAFGSMFGGYSTAVQVTAVEENGPAAKAGIKVGDLILGLGDKKADTSEALVALLNGFNAGDTVKITIQRNNQKMELDLILGEINGQS